MKIKLNLLQLVCALLMVLTYFVIPLAYISLPALHIPGVALEGTADYGLQLVGARFSDARLLSCAARLSREQGA